MVPRPTNIGVGSQVMLRNHPVSRAEERFHAGFAPRYTGPYEVVEQLSAAVVMVNVGQARPVRAHINDLREVPARPAALNLPEPQEEEQEEEGEAAAPEAPLEEGTNRHTGAVPRIRVPATAEGARELRRRNPQAREEFLRRRFLED